MEIRNRWTSDIIAEGETLLAAAESKKANLREADLYGADLYMANLSGANLRRATLRGANLCEADLSRANLSGANLCEANLSGANLSGADLREADLCGANLSGADFRGAKYGEDSLLKYLAIGPIGSRNDYLQVFITCNNVAVRTGCFSGTLDDLAKRTNRDDYKAAISFIKNTVESVRK